VALPAALTKRLHTVAQNPVKLLPIVRNLGATISAAAVSTLRVHAKVGLDLIQFFSSFPIVTLSRQAMKANFESPQNTPSHHMFLEKFMAVVPRRLVDDCPRG